MAYLVITQTDAESLGAGNCSVLTSDLVVDRLAFIHTTDVQPVCPTLNPFERVQMRGS